MFFGKKNKPKHRSKRREYKVEFVGNKTSYSPTRTETITREFVSTKEAKKHAGGYAHYGYSEVNFTTPKGKRYSKKYKSRYD